MASLSEAAAQMVDSLREFASIVIDLDYRRFTDDHLTYQVVDSVESETLGRLLAVR